MSKQKVPDNESDTDTAAADIQPSAIPTPLPKHRQAAKPASMPPLPKTPKTRPVDEDELLDAPPVRQVTASQKAILAKIMEESLSRVNIDEFLDSRDRNEFHVPEWMIPDGFTVEWKNTAVMGMPVDSSYNTRLQMGGWQPAPCELFPELVPTGYDRPFVERPGMMLFIRPKRITDKIREADDRKARGQLNDKMAQLADTPEGNNQAPRTATTINRELEARIAVPKAAEG